LSRRPGGSYAATNHPCPLIPILVAVVAVQQESTASDMEAVVSSSIASRYVTSHIASRQPPKWAPNKRCWQAIPSHKFRVGQVVNYHPSRRLYAPAGVYTITARLPQRDDGPFEYRIKHPSEAHERIAGNPTRRSGFAGRASSPESRTEARYVWLWHVPDLLRAAWDFGSRGRSGRALDRLE
jgi:hypothetical protein